MKGQIKNQRILALIPARGGSKGIPEKNIRPLAGKPLIVWTIEQSLGSKYIDKIVVSTEDQKIAEISSKFGAEVIKRPEELAYDNSLIINTIFHILEFFEIKNEKYDIVILLQPTSPLREVKDIDSAIELFINSECDSIISVCEFGHSPYWAYKIDDLYLKPLFENSYLRMRRQDLPKSYVPNGAIYISTVAFIQEFKNFNSSRTLPFVMPAIRSVDIDTELDFIMAESIINMANK